MGNGSEEEVRIYYLDRDATCVESVKWEGGSGLEELLGALASDPGDLKLRSLLGSGVTLLSHELRDGQLVLDFGEDYLKLSKSEEVLFRASVVRTLCQSGEVSSVSFLVKGESLTDSSDVPYGAMSSGDFVDSGRNDSLANERTELVLYFADEAGESLVPEKRTVVYSANVAIEKIVVEQLIQGPVGEGCRATLSPDRTINSISVKEGICYVDLTEPMLDTTGAVKEEVSVYSIVNSLTEISTINRVQISIDGETARSFRGSLMLDRMFERNLDIIRQ